MHLANAYLAEHLTFFYVFDAIDYGARRSRLPMTKDEPR